MVLAAGCKNEAYYPPAVWPPGLGTVAQENGHTHNHAGGGAGGGLNSQLLFATEMAFLEETFRENRAERKGCICCRRRRRRSKGASKSPLLLLSSSLYITPPPHPPSNPQHSAACAKYMRLHSLDVPSSACLVTRHFQCEKTELIRKKKTK